MDDIVDSQPGELSLLSTCYEVASHVLVSVIVSFVSDHIIIKEEHQLDQFSEGLSNIVVIGRLFVQKLSNIASNEDWVQNKVFFNVVSDVDFANKHGVV